LAVAVAVALVVGVPLAVRALPASAPDLSAHDVVARVRAAAEHGYSGTVETSGDLDLPVTSHFTDIGALLGGRTTLRVWWRSADAWRVDKVLLAGETDLIHDGPTTTEWRYEDSRVTRSTDPDVRLPRSADLVPPTLASKVINDRGADRATRLPARRIAGVGAVGVRIRPAAKQSSIDHVDLWADPGNGVVLRLDVYGDGSSSPDFTTAFSTYTGTMPAVSTTRFRAPVGVRTRFDDVLDIADAANQYAPFAPPQVVAGLRRSNDADGAVGIYGSGLTRILAIPLRRRDASTLLDQVSSSPGMVGTDVGPSLMAGPLGVLVTDSDRSAWLLIGGVTRQTLVTAAGDLATGTRSRR
jgi:hypothetical protein